MIQVVGPVASGGPGPRYPMRPAARPSFVVIGWRWRWEIGVVVATALCVVVLLRVLGPGWVLPPHDRLDVSDGQVTQPCRIVACRGIPLHLFASRLKSHSREPRGTPCAASP